MKLMQEARTRFAKKKDHAERGKGGERQREEEKEEYGGVFNGERSNQPGLRRGKEVGGATQIKCR